MAWQTVYRMCAHENSYKTGDPKLNATTIKIQRVAMKCNSCLSSLNASTGFFINSFRLIQPMRHYSRQNVYLSAIQ